MDWDLVGEIARFILGLGYIAALMCIAVWLRQKFFNLAEAHRERKRRKQ